MIQKKMLVGVLTSVNQPVGNVSRLKEEMSRLIPLKLVKYEPFYQAKKNKERRELSSLSLIISNRGVTSTVGQSHELCSQVLHAKHPSVNILALFCLTCTGQCLTESYLFCYCLLQCDLWFCASTSCWSSSAVYSLLVSLLICWFMHFSYSSQTQVIPVSFFLYWRCHREQSPIFCPPCSNSVKF